MQFALVGGERVEAQKGLRGACPACKAEVHARVGTVRVRHWAHMGCAPCSEPETLWHRSWKSRFPAEWRERDQVSKHGVAHRADIETNIPPDNQRGRYSEPLSEKFIPAVTQDAILTSDLCVFIDCPSCLRRWSECASCPRYPLVSGYG